MFQTETFGWSMDADDGAVKLTSPRFEGNFKFFDKFRFMQPNFAGFQEIGKD